MSSTLYWKAKPPDDEIDGEFLSSKIKQVLENKLENNYCEFSFKDVSYFEGIKAALRTEELDELINALLMGEIVQLWLEY